MINHRDQRAVGLKAQKAASSALSTLTVMAMVLAYVMMTGHRLIQAQRSSDMPTALYTWENAGPTVATVLAQNSTTVPDVKITEFYLMASVPVTKTGSEKTVANTMVLATTCVMHVWDQTAMTVRTVSLTPMKTPLDIVYVRAGITQMIKPITDSGAEISVPNGTEPALMDALHVTMDTHQINVHHVYLTHTSTKMVYVNVTQTGPPTIVVNTSENVIHAVMVALPQAMVVVTAVPYTHMTKADSAYVIMTSPERTALSTKPTVTTNVLAVMTRHH